MYLSVVVVGEVKESTLRDMDFPRFVTVVFRVVRASCVSVEMGVLASLVLSTLPRPTVLLLMPETVPVKVGLFNGALPSSTDLRISSYTSSLAPPGIGSSSQ